MQIVILSYPQTWGTVEPVVRPAPADQPASDTQSPSPPPRLWAPLEALGSVFPYQSTTLPEFLERARRADVLVTTEFPLRRELLDYATRPQVLLVPADRKSSLVELSIADQLGIAVIGVSGGTDDGRIWVRNAAALLARHMRSANRQK
jgi:hypothetical protein